jgi:hypothetical protein
MSGVVPIAGCKEGVKKRRAVEKNPIAPQNVRGHASLFGCVESSTRSLHSVFPIVYAHTNFASKLDFVQNLRHTHPPSVSTSLLVSYTDSLATCPELCVLGSVRHGRCTFFFFQALLHLLLSQLPPIGRQGERRWKLA